MSKIKKALNARNNKINEIKIVNNKKKEKPKGEVDNANKELELAKIKENMLNIKVNHLSMLLRKVKHLDKTWKRNKVIFLKN